MISDNRISVHIEIVHCNIRTLVAGVVECHNIGFCIRTENDRFFNLIRMELQTCKFRMCCNECIIIYTGCQYCSRYSITRNIINFHILRNLYLLRIFRIFIRIQHELRSVAGCVCLFYIYKGDDILFIVSSHRQRFTACCRAVTRNSERLLCYFIANLEIRVGYCLAGCYRIVILINIINSVAQCFLRPMRINCCILFDLSIPVKQIISIS